MRAPIPLEGYEVTNPDGSLPYELDEVMPLGKGGSSSVYRARYRNSLERAVKILDPNPELTGLPLDEFVSSFRNEIRILSRITHQNIAKLVDFHIPASPGDLAMIVTEYVEGVTLDKFVLDSRSSGSDILEAFSQLLDALTHLHNSRILHGDVKPANVVVSRGESGAVRTILLDLGVGKHLPTPMTDQEQSSYTYYFTTERYALPELADVVANTSLNRIKLGRLLRLFPLPDLYALGLVIGELLALEDCESRITEAVGADGLLALRAVVEQLRSSDSASGLSAAEVGDELRRLGMRQLAPLGVAELGALPLEGRRLYLSTGRVLLTERMRVIVDHPLVQRLQRVPQLDLLSHVFPSARHSRFEHAIATLDLGRLAALHLLDDQTFRLSVSREQIEGFLLQALLSDVGHFQFLHMFEDFIRDRESEHLLGAQLLNDDETTRQLIGIDAPSGTDIAELAATQDYSGRTLEQLIDSSFHADWRSTLRSIQRPQTDLDCVMSGLLSSPVDIEKLAYLKMDAEFTGLPFGKAVDAEGIFSALRVPSRHDIAAHHEDGARLPGAVGLRESAISMVESAVLARYWQIQRGYWHVKNRALQAMVKFVILQLLKGSRISYPQFINRTAFSGVDASLEYLASNFEALRTLGLIPENMVNPVDGINRSQRYIYDRLLTVSPQSNIPRRKGDHVVYERLHRLSPLEQESIAETLRVELAGRMGIEINPGELLLDVPLSRRETLGGVVLVYSDNGAEFLGELFDVSSLLENLKQSFDLFAKRVRVFVSPRVADRLETTGRFQQARSVVFDHLKSIAN